MELSGLTGLWPSDTERSEKFEKVNDPGTRVSTGCKHTSVMNKDRKIKIKGQDIFVLLFFGLSLTKKLKKTGNTPILAN